MTSNEIEIVVSKKNNANLDQLGTQAKKAGKEVEEGLRKGFKGGEEAAEKSTKKIRDDLDKTGSKAKELGDSLGEKLIGAGAAGLAGAGALIGTTMMAGLSQVFEKQKIGGMLAAQTGSSAEAGGKLGEVAGATFADNFGESVAEVGEAIKAVMQNKLIDADASSEELQKLTGQAITAAQVVGEETNTISRAARQLLINGLAGSASEAMDIIVTASQQGLNVNEDLIDTIVEYSTKFRDLGISGPEAMGLISQAMDAGARDTDFAADALKEFSIRAIDGSEVTARGFRAIGLDAGDMGDAIAAGGDRAHNALKLTLDGLRSIHDPIQRDQAAVDLFGTKAEDLGDSLFNMDLDTAAAKFGEFADATDKAAEDITASTPAIEVAWRNLSQLPGKALEWASQSDAIDDVNQKLREHQAAAEKAAGTDEGFKDRVAAAEDAVRRSTAAVGENTRTLEENIEMSSKAAGGVLNLWDAQNSHAEALEKANESLKKNGENLNFNTEGGRANRDALSDLAKTTYDTIEAMEKQGYTSQEIQGVVAAQREEFVKLADKMGLSAKEANGLADKLGLIPGNYRATVSVDNEGANQRLQTTGELLRMLRDKTIRLSVQETRFISKEAQFGRFAAGGITGGGAPLLHRDVGGPGNSAIIAHEQGEEIIVQPNGSTVIPAGMSAMMFGGALGRGGDGGSSRPTRLWAEFGDADSYVAAMLHKMQRDGVLNFVVA